MAAFGGNLQAVDIAGSNSVLFLCSKLSQQIDVGVKGYNRRFRGSGKLDSREAVFKIDLA